MTRTTNPPTLRRPRKLPIDERHGIYERIYLGRRLTQTAPRLGEWARVVGRLPDPDELLRLADEMGVDPRWLAIGEYSPAGLAAAKLLVDSGFVDDPDEVAVATARLTPQPPAPLVPYAGRVCRYCGCWDEYACKGGCCWVDSDGTICSACLEPREEGPWT